MKEYVTWTEVESFIIKVVRKVTSSSKQFDGVYGLPRGGLVFAVMLSHRLDLPIVMSPTSNTLIIDDICDSGESLLHYIKNSSNEAATRPTVFTMYYKPNNKLGVRPDYYMKEKGDNWVVFPWE